MGVSAALRLAGSGLEALAGYCALTRHVSILNFFCLPIPQPEVFPALIMADAFA